MIPFAPKTLRELRDRREVAIRTETHPAIAITIWIVVSDNEVLVRSVRGAKGRWYRDLAGGGPLTLEFNGQRLAVQAVPATDAGSIERASREFLSRYRLSPYVAIVSGLPVRSRRITIGAFRVYAHSRFVVQAAWESYWPRRRSQPSCRTSSGQH